ncbi:MAG: hypothetical protein ACP59X_06175 [Solidesulfovibrio sp. DCME]|uniref:hypothetical protein n=1 Tax=Solidesulfovibrio sp. DCME TaxID=3447380 RepID=UPI003D12DFE3
MPTPSVTRPERPARTVLEVATDDCLAAARHVTACLARRAQVLHGLLCLPGPAGGGRLVVALADDGGLPRLLAELAALPQVLRVTCGQAVGADFTAAFLREAAA